MLPHIHTRFLHHIEITSMICSQILVSFVAYGETTDDTLHNVRQIKHNRCRQGSNKELGGVSAQ